MELIFILLMLLLSIMVTADIFFFIRTSVFKCVSCVQAFKCFMAHYNVAVKYERKKQGCAEDYITQTEF